MPTEQTLEEEWYKMLTEGETISRYRYHLLGLLPSGPRCKMCAAPFKGWGGFIMHLVGRDQSKYNPRFCQPCEKFDHPGGAEVPLTMLFADVRGSTRLAEQMSAREFSQLINRFYKVATHVLVQTDALVDRLMGDEAIGLFIPGFAGPEHPRRAIEAAQDLLKLTGHRDPKGPWIPVGIGIHTGPAFVGVVGEVGTTQDFTALGDNVNITARLASEAGPGEILISDALYEAANLDREDLERRQLELKGKSELTGVRVMRLSAK
ncbi:MAG TPA: adenylate/guanylate cyclase domain-containing protein [Anaerolineales bacterium]|jgi:adenylate cyclase|nr:adenylate/guanylate cyclase domain-containing protein [Anaerolineales bacterium]